jgi:type IV pilus assembly protein PilY1
MRAIPSKIKVLTLLCAAALQAQYAHAAVPSQQPLSLGASAPPLMMLVMQRDHKLYYEAYNDATDLDGDGIQDIGFKPSMTYLGYFDSNLCYTYSSSNTRFEPTAKATNMKCSSAWSGNWLNYMTTSRMDALRRVLYGGMRYSDTTTETVLQRAFIPQDAHSWGKQYTSTAVDGYSISDYTPLSQPTSGKRHIFANTTLLDTTNPLLRVRINSTDYFYNWVSKEQPVAGNTCATGGNNTHTCTGTLTDYVVRVQVCKSGLLDDVCTEYPNGNYKPTGLLQKYGANDSMHFGLLTGSYAKNLSGGVLRKNVGPFTDEVNTTTGQFLLTGDNDTGIVNTLNRFAVTGFGPGSYQYSCGWITTRAPTTGECAMWGNPIGEMMYEAVRYFAGSTATSNFLTTANQGEESTLKLPVATWKDPYKTVTNGGVGEKVCSKPFMMVISDINPSYDSDELPGANTNFKSSSFSGTLSSAGGSSLNVSTEADKIWTSEGLTTGNYFIGQSGSTTDNAPTAKSVSGFSSIRGLAPEEPTKQGSYYSAAVAEWARTNQVNSLSTASKIQTFSVVMASPLPRISIPIPNSNKKVTVIPFAKSVGGSSISATQGSFQPTDQLVDYYITSIKNTDTSNMDSTVNGGRPYYQFMINYEDVEQGADHDMDAIAQYTVTLNADNTVTVQVDSTYAAGGIIQHMGYVLSGSTADGTYLVVRDYDTTSGDPNYYLDSPSHPSSMLPLTSTKTFTAGTSSASFIPHDPLWYAAKWGGYKDGFIWDSDADGTPDNYYLVTNPAKLYTQLDEAFNEVVGRAASNTALSANSSQLTSSSRVYQATYNSANWSGDLNAYTINSNGGLNSLQWSAASQIPAASSRSIFTWKMSKGTSSTYTSAGASFSYASLTADQLSSLGQAPAFGTTTITATNQTNLINYIRGDHSNEGTYYRSRTSLMGDVINSSPVYGGTVDFGYDGLVSTEGGGSSYISYLKTKKTGAQTVYVGTNDGMMHAINASTGAERFTFIPNSAIQNLKYLASTDYTSNHKFFVDGNMFYSDAYTGVNGGATSSWKSFLAGTTGAGGNSVFLLDVTNADSFSASNVVWEFTNTELGYTMSTPTIAKMPNGRWAVIIGNGPESTSKTAKLFIIYLNVTLNDANGWDANQDYCVLSTDTTTDNGLGTPVVTLDSNLVAQYIYAGDVKGRMWRFNLVGSTTSSCPSTWTTNKVFTATTSSGTAQPITAAPAPIASNSGTGTMLLFGTGRYYASADPTDTTVQSLYGVLDPLTTTDPAITRSSLVAQTITGQTTGTVTRTDGSNTYSFSWTARSTSANTVDYTTKKGWYMDLTQSSGERVVSSPSVYNGTVLFPTFVPSADACTAGGVSWLYALNAQTGASLSTSYFDLNYSGTFDSADLINGTVASAVQYGVGGTTPTTLSGDSIRYILNPNSATTSNNSGSGSGSSTSSATSSSGTSTSAGNGNSSSGTSGSSSSSGPSGCKDEESCGLWTPGTRMVASWRQIK